ncbi:A24 family peptidase [Govanella unica]|uniref:Prepilin peptidase n=1 Tax=Govanella unica TaxID=2975056 RepID=A0A9X3Z884_9PROT|nr:prepilin peptidase [Govania unica]MDA5194972.1 prepilin peptidase [Govania unica]
MDMLKVLSLTFVLAMAVVLILAAIRDSRHYIIDNKTVLTVLVLALLFHGAQALLPAESRLTPAIGANLGSALILAVIIFALTSILFALNLMGGGDVKLLTVMMIWSGPALALPFLLLTAIAGGLLSAVVLLRIKLQARGLVTRNEASPIVNPLGSSLAPCTGIAAAKVPYGLGICVGGLYVAWVLAQRLMDVM